jgi:hypothetical protein
MYLLFIWRERNDFDAGKSNFEGHWKGWALKILTFLGPEKATSEGSVAWAQKSQANVFFNTLVFVCEHYHLNGSN